MACLTTLFEENKLQPPIITNAVTNSYENGIESIDLEKSSRYENTFDPYIDNAMKDLSKH